MHPVTPNCAINMLTCETLDTCVSTPHQRFYKDGATWKGSDPVNYAKFTHHEWEETAEAEAATVLENVGLGYGLFSTFRVHGLGAQERYGHPSSSP